MSIVILSLITYNFRTIVILSLITYNFRTIGNIILSLITYNFRTIVILLNGRANLTALLTIKVKQYFIASILFYTVLSFFVLWRMLFLSIGAARWLIQEQIIYLSSFVKLKTVNVFQIKSCMKNLTHFYLFDSICAILAVVVTVVFAGLFEYTTISATSLIIIIKYSLIFNAFNATVDIIIIALVAGQDYRLQL
ncbi:hypothetical protein AGLY_015264 [Aphis glycines]|uniref:Uncharacterized protein n=1 Tax=Aphis glycines TaxID=307491 RepID=A0A6G0T1K0_APHGL|nr:hypothetical protein AGLY_015264 [Aphis glycines]